VSVARIAVLALALTHLVGLADLVMDDSCEEQCDDDGCGTDCLPGVACRCHCPSAVPAVASSAQANTKLSSTKVAAPKVVQGFHVSPDPREILHVPKRAV